ncbi:uncharacterized protein LOC117299839 [Asterias rubens]|uniref:uncharacterized protein LOC117299839 n=1 Tax=Asterias rubens TaxID=7604 RepID=UPI0014553095|nr:uncharacterized protein LOC117299839 [Asterias rubens]
MSLPGYHPICVLFQGNDSALDGTYRLVCRHQVRQRDFNPGDNVEVDMGDDIGLDGRDDDDVTVISDQDDDQRWKDAIALGDEMVMSLLRNLCKNQPAGKNPWSASHQKIKRRRDDDERATKKIKAEPGMAECTTSQGRSDKADSSHTDLLLQKVLSAVQSLQHSQDLVMSEMHTIQQTQRTLSSQVTAVQKSLSHLQENANKGMGYSASSNLAAMATPISLYLSQNTTSSTQPTNEDISCLGISQPQPSPSTQSSSDSQIVISNPTSQNQSSLSIFHTEESLNSLATYPAQASPLYSISQIPYNFRYTDDNESQVFIGYTDSPLTLSKNEMDDIIFKTNTPASFAYRLTSKIFSNEELLLGNTTGNASKKSGKTYKKLNPTYVDIILMEVESRFPSCRNTKEGTKRLFTAINERCRNERKKMVYRYQDPIFKISKTQSLSTEYQDD